MLNNELSEFTGLMKTTFEYYDKITTETVMTLYWNGLKKYELDAVKNAIGQHIETNKFMPKISCIIDLLPDTSGWLSPNEAWEALPKTESDGGYVTDAMMSAFPFDLIDMGDMVAARMAFIEAYKAAVTTSKADGTKPAYFYSGATQGTYEQKQQIKSSALLIARDRKWISPTTFKELNALLATPISNNNPCLEALEQTANGLKKIGSK